MATKTNTGLTKLRVTHTYTLVVDTGDLPPIILADLVRDRLDKDNPIVFGILDSDYGLGTGADFGESSTEEVTVEVL